MTKDEIIRAIIILTEIVNTKSTKHLDDDTKDKAADKIKELIKLL